MSRRSSALRARGVITVMVAAFLVLLLGFAALAIDTAVIAAAKRELTTSADNCALSTMRMLGNVSAETSLEELQVLADAYARQFMAENTVAGMSLMPYQVMLGSAAPDGPRGRYMEFAPVGSAASTYNAVRIGARLADEGSDDTRLRSVFGHLLGSDAYALERTAHVVLKPWNIALCVDGSNSMSYDSRLWQLRDIMDLRAEGFSSAQTNLDAIWQSYPKSPAPYSGYVASVHDNHPDWGPVYGAFMEGAGYGVADADIDLAYRPRSDDDGLLFLPIGASWDAASADGAAAGQAPRLTAVLEAQQYSTAEIAAVQTAGNGDEASWRRHAKVALGLIGWNSGKPDGDPGDRPRWAVEGWPDLGGTGGAGDDVIDEAELVDLPGVGQPPNLGNWEVYIDSVRSYDFSIDGEPETDYADFSYCYGAKTLTHFMVGPLGFQDDNYPDLTQGFAITPSPIQPWHSTRASIAAFMGALGAFNSNDRIALLRYGTASSILMGLQSTGNLAHINNALTADLPRHGATNTAGVLADAIALLASQEAFVQGEWEDANLTALPPVTGGDPIIILLTDGLPTRPCGQPGSPTCVEEATHAAMEQAEIAAGLGIKIHTISIGVSSDPNFGQALSAAGWPPGAGGLHIHAEGGYIAQQDVMTAAFNNELLRLGRTAQLIGHDLIVTAAD